MSAFLNISQALIDHYRAGAFFTDSQTAWENAAFVKPANTQAWSAVFLLPNQPTSESSGAGGGDGHTGIFQIDINYPANSGSVQAMTKADSVSQYFKGGTRIAYGGQQVQILTCGRSQGRPVDGWYRVSLTINWTAFVQR